MDPPQPYIKASRSLGERADEPLSLVPDLKLPGTLPWHAFRAILQGWEAASQSQWVRIAADYVDEHLVTCQGLPEPLARRRRHDVTQALLGEILDLAQGGWR